LAFSFAANSCLTLRLMASTSTLYAVVASRSTCAAFCLVAACRMVCCSWVLPPLEFRFAVFKP
jgi:hypothetical protein